MPSALSDHEVPAAEDDVDAGEIVFGRAVVPVIDRNKLPRKDKLGFEYAEHCFIGDAITLTLANGGKVAASSYQFQLPDRLSLTYGQINGLNAQEQLTRFVAAYNTLANGGPRQPKEATDILAILQGEVDAVNKALANHQDPSVAYAQLPDVSVALERITWGWTGFPGYLGLAQINWDHFVADARTAYNAGHATALHKAISGDLLRAYVMNAFADHFLEDSFTPPPHPAVNLSADICAKYMHDEDCAIGIFVENPGGERWMVFSDKRGLDTVDKDNKVRCVNAVQASADEIYTGVETKQVPAPANYRAWTFAPTLESARATTQTLATLFNFAGSA
ncbi:hypothetical protein K439DRAFT_1655174 [Ramaria rubella]|nr:hypothetical protein K439DRAFT_1655174 [Ramaria rubella]